MGGKSPITSASRGSTAAHSALVNEILLALNPFGRFKKNNTGVATSASGNVIRYGAVGWPDIEGILRGSGRYCGIEVKTGNASQSKEQRAVQKVIEDLGGIYILARSKTQVVEELACLINSPAK